MSPHARERRIKSEPTSRLAADSPACPAACLLFSCQKGPSTEILRALGFNVRSCHYGLGQVLLLGGVGPFKLIGGLVARCSACSAKAIGSWLKLLLEPDSPTARAPVATMGFWQIATSTQAFFGFEIHCSAGQERPLLTDSQSEASRGSRPQESDRARFYLAHERFLQRVKCCRNLYGLDTLLKRRVGGVTRLMEVCFLNCHHFASLSFISTASATLPAVAGRCTRQATQSRTARGFGQRVVFLDMLGNA